MQTATVIISNGTVTREPETRFTPSGTTQMKFSTVVNHRERKDGEWVEHADFYNVTVWGKAAESLVALRDGGSFVKGSRVDVVGRLTHRPYKGRDGSEKVSFDVNANDVILVSPPKGYQGEGSAVNFNAPPAQQEADLNDVPF